MTQAAKNRLPPLFLPPSKLTFAYAALSSEESYRQATY
jgi:hypothetical protein